MAFTREALSTLAEAADKLLLAAKLSDGHGSAGFCYKIRICSPVSFSGNGPNPMRPRSSKKCWSWLARTQVSRSSASAGRIR